MAARPRALLVVDDDPDIGALTAALLRDAGYRVTAVATEAAALAALAARRYDLVLMDPLGAASGVDPGRWAALERVRAAAGGTPTVIFTAHPPAAFAEWRARGFAGLLAKPFDCADLLAAVAAALAAPMLGGGGDGGGLP
ncbi:MAG TPA: response regulator [Thermomicrobiales bacterium]|nr:response regulator [Thermomicrobiales bacterium]